MNARGFARIIETGDALLRTMGVVPVDLSVGRFEPRESVARSRFDGAFDTYTMEHCAAWASQEINLLHAYCEATAGLARKKRPRLIVYQDSKGGVRYARGPYNLEYYPPAPTLAEQERITDEQLLQEVGVW